MPKMRAKQAMHAIVYRLMGYGNWILPPADVQESYRAWPPRRAIATRKV